MSRVFSIILLSLGFVYSSALYAHEIEPAIVSIAVEDNRLNIEVELSLEAVLADVDLSQEVDTRNSVNEAEYNRLRALNSSDLEANARLGWGKVQDKISLVINGKPAALNLTETTVIPQTDIEIARLSIVKMSADIPQNASEFKFGWASELGLMVLRRTDLENGFAGYVEPGELSPPLALVATGETSQFKTFAQFVPVGFDHIIPKGLDHILFVIGLFLFSTKMRPLLWQISAFTLAHTITLALASMKIVAIPASIVEPLIAISIAYVAIENIFVTKISMRRPMIIFGFGLLHGLGFASVLAEFGLPGAGFVAALIGFNVGVEIGQLAVISACFFGMAFWLRDKEWYRSAIVIPLSVIIAVVGLWWAFERIFLG